MLLRPLPLLLGLAAGFWLVGCKKFASLPDAEPTLLEPITAKRERRGPYVLTNILPEEFEVYISDSARFHQLGRQVGTLLAGSPDTPATLIVRDVLPQRRYYFDLVGDAGNRLRVSERQLPLEGADNFRDLGGLPGADGKRVVWGQFYRADNLSALTDFDLAYLGSLELRSVVDLRSPQEVASAPDRLPQSPDLDYIPMPIYNEAEDTSDIRGRILAGTFGLEEADNLLEEVNRLFGSSQAFRFAPFMKLIESDDGAPMVYHCTSGKDRTGFATFLLLRTLGVDSALIFDDYLMSNYYRFDRNRRNLRKVNLAQYVKPVNPEVLKPLMLVDPGYLRAGVEEIDSTYGSVDSFLLQEYGVTDSVKADLRQRYLYE